MLDELLSRIGTPGLILAFAAVVWVKIEANSQGIRDLWDLVNGKDGHAKDIAWLKAKLEDLAK